MERNEIKNLAVGTKVKIVDSWDQAHIDHKSISPEGYIIEPFENYYGKVFTIKEIFNKSLLFEETGNWFWHIGTIECIVPPDFGEFEIPSDEEFSEFIGGIFSGR